MIETIIYVKLLDEGTEVFRPVKAVQIEGNIYQIVEEANESEEWEFKQNEKVLGEEKLLEGELCLVAVKRS